MHSVPLRIVLDQLTLLPIDASFLALANLGYRRQSFSAYGGQSLRGMQLSVKQGHVLSYICSTVLLAEEAQNSSKQVKRLTLP